MEKTCAYQVYPSENVVDFVERWVYKHVLYKVAPYTDYTWSCNPYK